MPKIYLLLVDATRRFGVKVVSCLLPVEQLLPSFSHQVFSILVNVVPYVWKTRQYYSLECRTRQIEIRRLKPFVGFRNVTLRMGNRCYLSKLK